MPRKPKPRVPVYEIRAEGWPRIMRFLDQGEAQAFAARCGALTAGRTVPATDTQLWRWGLGPMPPKRDGAMRRPPRTHPPRCPSCGAYWHGPGRPRKGQPRALPSPRLTAPSKDGSDGTSSEPWSDRPDLAGLWDPRLADDGEP